jgi:hypothetical protein
MAPKPFRGAQFVLADVMRYGGPAFANSLYYALALWKLRCLEGGNVFFHYRHGFTPET